MKPDPRYRRLAIDAVNICIAKGHRPALAWDGSGPAIIWSPPLPRKAVEWLAKHNQEALIDAVYEIEEREAIRREGQP